MFFSHSIHICVTLVHTKPGVADKFVAAVEKAVKEIMADKNPKMGGQVSYVNNDACAASHITLVIFIEHNIACLLIK